LYFLKKGAFFQSFSQSRPELISILISFNIFKMSRSTSSSARSTPSKATTSSSASPTTTQNSTNIRVVCRIRPENHSELASDAGVCIENIDECDARKRDLESVKSTEKNAVVKVSLPEKKSLGSQEPPKETKTAVFRYSDVLGPNVSQEEVFFATASPLVDRFLQGKNSLSLFF
jgi:hypothetical protein